MVARLPNNRGESRVFPPGTEGDTMNGELRISLRATAGMVAAGLVLALAGTAQAADGPGVGNLSYTAEYANPQALKPLAIIKSTCGDGSPRNMDHVFMHRGWMIGAPSKDSAKKGGG